MKRLFFTIISLFAAWSVSAQTTINVQVPSVVSLDEQFNLSFVVEGEKASDFQWPQTPDFDVQWGPQTGRSSQTTFINGKITKSVSTTYTYVLMPKKEGTFTIPSCSVKVKGKTLTSNPITVKVVKGSARQPSSSASQSASTGTVSGEDLFMRLIVDKRNVVLGEPINATLKLYKRVPVSGFEDVHFPSFDGFWSQTLSNPSNIEFQRESLGDEVYETAVLRSYKIIPQKVGELVIEPAELVCVVQVRTGSSSSGSIFDSFFQNDYSSIRKRVSSKQVSIRVEDLPQPQPESFCGGVGKFNIAMQLSRDSVFTHDATSLVVKIKGQGNLNLLEAPKIKFPADFELYDVKASDADGQKIFEYPFIPRHHGQYTLGPVEFSYFDVESRQYKTIKTQAINIDVKRSQFTESESSPVPYIGTVGKDVKDLGSDIRYIATGSSNVKETGVFFVASPVFLILCIVIVVISILAVIITSKTRKRKEDISYERRRGASKAVKKRLAQSENYLKQGLNVAFYEELHKALLGFLSDKFSLDMSEMDKETIKDRLVDGGVPQNVADEYVSLLDTCEYARYAPSSEGESLQEVYKKALDVVGIMDGSLNKKHIKKPVGAMLVALMIMGGAPQNANAQSQDPWNEGVTLYSAGDYQGAFDKWQSILDEGKESAELYYNLGCASFKLSELSYSVLYYEKALKLDPTYSDARHNLEYVSQFLQDRIESVPEFFLVRWMRAARSAMTSDGWAYFALFFLLLAAAGAILYFLSSRKGVRVAGFVSGVIALLLFAGCLSFSVSLKKSASDRSCAVVMSAVTVVKSSPDENSGTDLFVLHEGTKTKITQQIGEWYNIELSDGRQGWTRKSNLELI